MNGKAEVHGDDYSKDYLTDIIVSIWVLFVCEKHEETIVPHHLQPNLPGVISYMFLFLSHLFN